MSTTNLDCLNELGDCQLLDRFLIHGDADAFGELIARYGGLVQSICRRLLYHAEDVEDAFQATFLALLKDGGSIRCARYGSWLYRVAFRVSLRLRDARERPLALDDVVEPADEWDAFRRIELRETQIILEEELNRLPERLRAPLIMFHFEQCSRKAVAETLGCSLDTVGDRLRRARQTLRMRMLRRGIGLSATLATLQLASQTVHPAATSLVGTTIAMGSAWWAGDSLASGISKLSEGVVRECASQSIQWNVVRAAGAILLVAAVLLGTRGETARANNYPAPATEVIVSVPAPERNEQFVTAPLSEGNDVSEFSALRDEWERAVMGHQRIYRLLPFQRPPKPKPPLRGKQLLAAERRLGDRCLELAEKSKVAHVQLAALYLAAVRGARLEYGPRAQKRLIQRLQNARPKQIHQAVQLSGVRQGGHTIPLRDFQGKSVFPEIARAALKQARQNIDDPEAAKLLSLICVWGCIGDETEVPPKHFREAAHLIVTKVPDSPDIYNFCELLGSINSAPQWAPEFEKHLRRILQLNKHRYVRFAASVALASTLQVAEGRQMDAISQYEKVLKTFDGKHKYPFQNVEKLCLNAARARLMGMRFAPIGQPAPEILGVDLKGQPLKLSSHRGKVVMVSFWATWCFPCMKLIPHERQLVQKLGKKPFVLIGVNGDRDPKAALRAARQHKISWSSFQDKRPGKSSISDQWYAVYPTVVLIDHKGIVRNRWSGAPLAKDLDRQINKLLEAIPNQSREENSRSPSGKGNAAENR